MGALIRLRDQLPFLEEVGIGNTQRPSAQVFQWRPTNNKELNLLMQILSNTQV